jgi:PTH1 family peptidyl-tRNA hydrolase
MVVDELAARSAVKLTAHKARAVAATVRIGTLPGGAPGPAAVVAVPSSYMNESGGPVKALMKFFSADPERLVVIHDELDIPFAAIRLKLGGGDNGHNGLRSVTAALGTRDYYRVRCGIGRPAGRMDAADFVLHDFSGPEPAMLPEFLSRCADAVEVLLASGLAVAQNRFHPGISPEII